MGGIQYFLCLSVAFFASNNFLPSSGAKLPKCNDNNYLKTDEAVYDTEESKTITLEGDYYTNDIKNIDVTDNAYVRVESQNMPYRVSFTLSQIDEEAEISKEGNYYYNFTLKLECDTGDYSNYAFVPLIDTNNHEPFFDKPKHTYNLISSYEEDFKRQQILQPIIATDYDITNTALQFSIEENNYFDITYNGIVPNTLNKKHYALLTPKAPGKLITEKIEVFITVTDMGFPPRSNVSKLVIIPPSPSTPIFKLPFYVGHYYKNHTFVMAANPELEEGCTYYLTRVEILTLNGEETQYFRAEISDGKIFVENTNNLDYFYEENYTAYELRAYYTDPATDLFSIGKATFIVEHHHYL